MILQSNEDTRVIDLAVHTLVMNLSDDGSAEIPRYSTNDGLASRVASAMRSRGFDCATQWNNNGALAAFQLRTETGMVNIGARTHPTSMAMATARAAIAALGDLGELPAVP